MVKKLKTILNLDNYRKTYRYLQKNGWQSVYYAAKERIYEKNRDRYEIKLLTEEELTKQREQARQLSDKNPLLISILVPLYETKPDYLRELLDSVRNQTYTNWELILADASESDNVRECVKEYIRSHQTGCERIRYIRLEKNQGISANSNEALSYAEGAYIGLLDHDDTIAPDALYEMARAVCKQKEAGIEAVILYSDEDKMNGNGTEYYEPNYKEKFNLDLFLSNNYICHFLVIKRTVIEQVKFRPLYDGAQDYDLVLQCSRRCSTKEEIIHVPKVLYHWRCHEQSTAVNPQSKMYAYEAGRKAVCDYCRDMGYKVRIRHMKHLGFYDVEYLHDIFRVRKDVGLLGGRLLKQSVVVGGAYLENGTVLYENLPKQFSGYMHRAVLQQDVDAVDIRCMKIREELKPLLEEAVQIITGKIFFDIEQLVQEATREQIKQISILLGKKVREAGYLVLFDPKMEITL